jgi:hypothetical protein
MKLIGVDHIRIESRSHISKDNILANKVILKDIKTTYHDYDSVEGLLNLEESYMNMQIEWDWYPEDSTILELELKVKYKINYIRFEIDFEITKFYPATFNDPAEGDELVINGMYPMFLTTQDMPNVPVTLNKEMRCIIGDWAPDSNYENDCRAAWGQRSNDYI